jgi:hypothetical protein
LGSTLVLIGALLVPASASAYCRASVQTSPLGPCEEDPDLPLLHWTRGCAQYAFHRDFFARMNELDEDQIRADYQAAFAQYAAVDCGREPFAAVQLQAPATAERAEFDWDVQNESVMAVRTADEWSALGYDDRAIALTLLYFDPDNGEIYDVDMELNDGAGQFVHCDEECFAGEVDLPSTLAHEVGHYLGLGHSTVPGSTMLAKADTTIERRTIEADDREGYCALELPEPVHDDHGELQCDTPVFTRFTRKSTTPHEPQPDCALLPQPMRGPPASALLAFSAPLCWLVLRRALRRRERRREHELRRVVERQAPQPIDEAGRDEAIARDR